MAELSEQELNDDICIAFVPSFGLFFYQSVAPNFFTGHNRSKFIFTSLIEFKNYVDDKTAVYGYRFNQTLLDKIPDKMISFNFVINFWGLNELDKREAKTLGAQVISNSPFKALFELIDDNKIELSDVTGLLITMDYGGVQVYSPEPELVNRITGS